MGAKRKQELVQSEGDQENSNVEERDEVMEKSGKQELVQSEGDKKKKIATWKNKGTG